MRGQLQQPSAPTKHCRSTSLRWRRRRPRLLRAAVIPPFYAAVDRAISYLVSRCLHFVLQPGAVRGIF